MMEALWKRKLIAGGPGADGERRNVALKAADVAEFLAAEKQVAADARWTWRSRNLHNRRCHLPLEAGGARVGEIVLVVNLATSRHWSFKLLRRKAEVLRWDFARPPVKHRNPRSCGDDFPRIVRDLEQEHEWHPQAGLNCARGLPDLAAVDEHRQAFVAFADRANITVLSPYQAPPVEGEQMPL